jgi:hypothetical protein
MRPIHTLSFLFLQVEHPTVLCTIATGRQKGKRGKTTKNILKQKLLIRETYCKVGGRQVSTTGGSKETEEGDGGLWHQCVLMIN